ncbi:MAG: hypothetical protein EP315_09100 [Gammaproteobacteria bacterium]|nr:MAG: hypothetical protein EP315_09100 [Gammaproteobacteria bacterium]
MPAYTRHNEVLILDSKPGEVDAHYFNVVQIALKRMGEQIRIKIPTLNHLDLIVQEDAWIVVDRVLHDMPVACWTAFQIEGRDNLHEPISCEVRIYHFAARAILQKTLDAMKDFLRESFAEQYNDKGAKVVPLKKTKKHTSENHQEE